MRAQVVAVFAFAVISCLAISLYRDADAQAAPLLRPPSFPPHPADIVNIDGGLVYAEAQGFDQTVFTVPAGRWLVVTDVRTYAPSPALRVVQRSGGTDVNKLTYPWTGATGPGFNQGERQSAIGYAFPAGSAVVMKVDPVPNGNTAFIYKSYWNLVGYLAN